MTCLLLAGNKKDLLFTYCKMQEANIQEIRDWFDELFLERNTTLKLETKALFETLGIVGFAESLVSGRDYGFISSQNILSDLTKLSFAVYQNLDMLPLSRKLFCQKQMDHTNL